MSAGGPRRVSAFSPPYFSNKETLVVLRREARVGRQIRFQENRSSPLRSFPFHYNGNSSKKLHSPPAPSSLFLGGFSCLSVQSKLTPRPQLRAVEVKHPHPRHAARHQTPQDTAAPSDAEVDVHRVREDDAPRGERGAAEVVRRE